MISIMCILKFIFCKEIIAAVVAVLLAYFFGKTALLNQYKIEVARDLFAARYQLTKGQEEKKTMIQYDMYDNAQFKLITDNDRNEWNKALNSVQIVFGKDEKVQSALRNIHKAQTPDTIQEILIEVGISAKLLKRKDVIPKYFNPSQQHFL